MTRYTSPDLSRQLAEAGLEQDHEDRNQMHLPWWVSDSREGKPPHLHVNPLTSYLPAGCVRALDLTDVLAEIEKRGATWLVETDHGTYCATAVLNPTFSAVMGGPSAVEAAGLCLLALMDKLRETKLPSSWLAGGPKP